MKTHFQIALVIALLLAACNKEDNPAPGNGCEAIKNTRTAATRYFEFKHPASGDLFIAWTNNQPVIDAVLSELAKPENERSMHINGGIAELPQGCNLNKDWSWYFLPDDWALAEISIEVCDGNPQYVEENLDDYLQIGRYCPWSAYVLREMERPD